MILVNVSITKYNSRNDFRVLKNCETNMFELHRVTAFIKYLFMILKF